MLLILLHYAFAMSVGYKFMEQDVNLKHYSFPTHRKKHKIWQYFSHNTLFKLWSLKQHSNLHKTVFLDKFT